MSSTLERVLELAKGRGPPNLLLHGVSGSGKRTVAEALLDKLYGAASISRKEMVMYVDCSKGCGLKYVREDIKGFAQTQIAVSAGPTFKVIVFINADHLGQDAQSALRRCIEQFSHSTRFIMLVCDTRKLLLPIVSRFCKVLCIGPETEGEWHIKRVRHAVGDCPWSTSDRAWLTRTLAEWRAEGTSALETALKIHARGISAGAVRDALPKQPGASVFSSDVTSEPLLIACILAAHT